MLIFGWYLRRFLQEKGKIRCKIALFHIDFRTFTDKWGEFKSCQLAEAETGFYTIELDFFSEKDNQIAITKPSLVFKIKNGKKYDIPVSPHYNDFEHNGVKGGFNLPSRKLTRISWMGHIDNKMTGDLEKIINSKKAVFVGYLPNGKKVKKVILTRPIKGSLSSYFPESIEIEG